MTETPTTQTANQIAKALLEMNSTVVESIFTGVMTTVNDPLEIVQIAVQQATQGTLDTLDDYVAITLVEPPVGAPIPWFASGELSAAYSLQYIESINS